MDVRNESLISESNDSRDHPNTEERRAGSRRHQLRAEGVRKRLIPSGVLPAEAKSHLCDGVEAQSAYGLIRAAHPRWLRGVPDPVQDDHVREMGPAALGRHW